MKWSGTYQMLDTSFRDALMPCIRFGCHTTKFEVETKVHKSMGTF
jgi:hypothetical protein